MGIGRRSGGCEGLRFYIVVCAEVGEAEVRSRDEGNIIFFSYIYGLFGDILIAYCILSLF